MYKNNHRRNSPSSMDWTETISLNILDLSCLGNARIKLEVLKLSKVKTRATATEHYLATLQSEFQPKIYPELSRVCVSVCVIINMKLAGRLLGIITDDHAASMVEKKCWALLSSAQIESGSGFGEGDLKACTSTPGGLTCSWWTRGPSCSRRSLT